MKLAFVTIVPVELYTREARICLEETLEKNKTISRLKPQDKTAAIYEELLPPETSFYNVSLPDSDVTGAIFIETTLCLLMEKTTEVDFRDKPLDTLNRLLRERRDIHIEIIKGKGGFLKLIKSLIHDLDGICQGEERDYFKSKINYAFSFYVLFSTDAFDRQNIVYAKIFAEPSIIGNEDMTSIERQSLITDLNDISDVSLRKIKNIDLLSTAQTFITWASMASIVKNEEDWHITKDLLIAMEVRVQSIWNKCFCINSDIDYIIRHEINIKNKELKKIYWNTLNTIDKAKGAISSTFSSRAGKFFANMIQTSNLHKEVEKLKDKLNFLEKYLKEKKESSEKVYKKFLNLYLLFIMIFAMLQLFIPIPIFKNPEYGWVIVAIIAVIGIAVNLKIDT